jgi:hypothetical protein
MRPSARPALIASWAMMPSREKFSSTTPGFTTSSEPIENEPRVASFSGTWKLMKSEAA